MARNYGTGTKTEIRPGVWRLRVSAGTDPETGHPRQLSRTVHFDKKRGTKNDAEDALQKFVGEVKAGEVIGTTATVGNLLTAWLADLERLGKARSTMESYKAHVEKHLRPGLGRIRLDKLGVQDIDRYLGALADKGLAPRTIRLDHAVLRAALNQAERWGWIRSNPAVRARLKAPETKPVKEFTAEHVAKLYQAAIADEDIDLAMLIALAAITGCRRGELAGLRWDDVDAERCCLRVERQWIAGQGGQYLSGKTKSGNGRTVYIGPNGVELLEQYRSAKREQLGGREPAGWLLSANGGTTPLRVKAVSDYISEKAKKLNVPGTLHTLRHWKQTEMNRQGVDLPTAAAQGGHTVAVMASTYLHTDDARAAAAGELVAGVVVGAIKSAESAHD